MRIEFHWVQTAESTDGDYRRSVCVGIALCRLVEQVVEFGVYGQVEDGSEVFRWKPLRRRDSSASSTRAECVLGEHALSGTGIVSWSCI